MKSELLTWCVGFLALTLAGSALAEDAARARLEVLRGQEFWRVEEERKSPVATGVAALEWARWQGRGLIFDEDPTKAGLVYRWESAAGKAGEDPTSLPAVVEEAGVYWRIERWVLMPTRNETNRNFLHHHGQLRKTEAWFHLRELVGQDGSYSLLSAERRDQPADWEERRLEAIYAGVRERIFLEWKRENTSWRWVEDGLEQPYLLDLGMHEELQYTYPPGMPPRVVRTPMRANDKNVPMTEAELFDWTEIEGDGYTRNRTRAIHSARSGLKENYELTLDGTVVMGASLAGGTEVEWVPAELPVAEMKNSDRVWREASHGKTLLGWDAAGITVHVSAQVGVRVGTR